MQEYPIAWVAVILVLLVVNALAAAAETAYDQMLGGTVKKRAEEEKRAKRAAFIFDHKKRCTTVLDLLRTVTVFSAGGVFVVLTKATLVPMVQKAVASYPLSEVCFFCSKYFTFSSNADNASCSADFSNPSFV